MKQQEVISPGYAKTLRPTAPEAEAVLGLYFSVLDYGFVSLVDYMGSDAAIVQAARVSYGAGTRSARDGAGLVDHLRRHRHTTPTEMVEFKFHCAMPMFVARQWIRHRTASVNEYSGRYSLMPLVFYTPPASQLRAQSATNRQGRGEEALDFGQHEAAAAAWNDGRDRAVDTYLDLADADVARELARIDLPLSTYTQWYWKIDLHNLLHFLTLRVDAHAQWEIREYARVMAGLVRRVAPLSYAAWIEHDVAGVRFGAAERSALWQLLSDPALNGAGSVEGAARRAGEESGLKASALSEFVAKIAPPDRPEFRVDPADGKPPQYFADRFAAADAEAVAASKYRRGIGAPENGFDLIAPEGFEAPAAPAPSEAAAPEETADAVPVDIASAVDTLVAQLGAEDKAALRAKGYLPFHQTLGRWVRNAWGLWSGGPLKDHLTAAGLTHADDMSSVVLGALVARLRGTEFDLGAAVARYRRFWEASRSGHDPELMAAAADVGPEAGPHGGAS
jgi:thymidylate synthase (FAD)